MTKKDFIISSPFKGKVERTWSHLFKWRDLSCLVDVTIPTQTLMGQDKAPELKNKWEKLKLASPESGR